MGEPDGSRRAASRKSTPDRHVLTRSMCCSTDMPMAMNKQGSGANPLTGGTSAGGAARGARLGIELASVAENGSAGGRTKPGAGKKLSDSSLNSVSRPQSSRGSISQWKPTDEQIMQYCEFLGMDLARDAHLMYIAADALTAPIPPPWREYETPDGYVYYVNTKTGKSSWEHPLDSFYKNMYLAAKREEQESKEKRNSGTPTATVSSPPAAGPSSSPTAYQPETTYQPEPSRNQAETDRLLGAARDKEFEALRKELELSRDDKKKETARLREQLEKVASDHSAELAALRQGHEKRLAEVKNSQKAIQSEIETLRRKHAAAVRGRGEDVEMLVLCTPMRADATRVLKALEKRLPGAVGVAPQSTTRPEGSEATADSTVQHVSADKFKSDIKDDAYLVQGQASGGDWLRGWTRTAIDKVNRRGKVCALLADAAAARQIKTSGIAARFVFIAAPGGLEAAEAAIRADQDDDGADESSAVEAELKEAKAAFALLRESEGAKKDEQEWFHLSLASSTTDAAADALRDGLVDWFPRLRKSAEEREQGERKVLQLSQQVLELTERCADAEATRAQVARLTQELDAKTKQLGDAEKRIQDADSTASERLEAQEKRLVEMKNVMDEVKANLERVRRERGEAQSALKQSKEEADSTNAELAEAQTEISRLSSEAKRTAGALARAETQIEDADAEIKELKEASRKASSELLAVRQENTRLGNRIDVLDKITSAGLHKDHQACIRELSVVAVKCKELDLEVTQSRKVLASTQAKLTAVQATVHKAELDRRAALNKLQDLQGNIRVMVRVRPLLGAERKRYRDVPAPVTCAPTTGGVSIVDGERGHDFQFNHVFDPQTDQPVVFDEVTDLVQSALDGYNVCLFAYGQTGSGKTFTMQGDEGKTRGLIPRAVEKIIEVAGTRTVQGWEFDIKGSMLEIYNEQVRDLLVKNSPNLDIKMKGKKTSAGTHVPGLSKWNITSMRDMAKLVDTATRNRSVAATAMNTNSSRSHSVFTLYLKGRNKAQRIETESALFLCDLAGSERIAKSGVQGQRLKEAVMINKSLSALSDVFQALARGDKHVPFRNSKLTYLLQCCFVGNGKTLMFVNLSPVPTSSNESLCSLRFAQKVNQCVMGPATTNASRLTVPRSAAASLKRSPVKPPSGKPKFARTSKKTRKKQAKQAASRKKWGQKEFSL